MKTMLMIALGLSLSGFAAVAADAAPTLPEGLKKYDKNGDGKIDQEERAAMQKERNAELLKKYDKNGDGKIDENERKAVSEDIRKERAEIIKKRQAELGKDPQKKVEDKK